MHSACNFLSGDSRSSGNVLGINELRYQVVGIMAASMSKIPFVAGITWTTKFVFLQAITYPIENLVGDMFYRVIEKIRQDRDNGQSGQSWTPSTDADGLGVLERFLSLFHGGMDGKGR